MTLSDIASFVCTKVGQPDSASLAVCQGFINARYRQVWDTAAWREALLMATVPVATDGSGIAVIPQAMDRVMAVRASSMGSTTLNNFLAPFELNTVFQYDATLWDASPGNPVFFSTLDPTAIPGPMGQGENYGLSQGYDFVTVSTNPLSAEGTAGEANGVNYNQTLLDAGATVYVAGLDALGNYQEVTVTLGNSATGIPGVGIWTLQATSGSTAEGGMPTAQLGLFSEVSAVSKSATANGIQVGWNTQLASAQTPAFTAGTYSFLRPADTSGPTFERIKLLSPPAAGADNAVTLLVLGKKRFTALQNPSSTPILRSCSNVLIALATGDMLERQRQYGKAQAKFAEAKEQLEILLGIERDQAASDIRIIPAEIHSAWPDYGCAFGANGKGFW